MEIRQVLRKDGGTMNIKEIRKVIRLLDENPGLVEIEVNVGFGRSVRVSRSDQELPVPQTVQPLVRAVIVKETTKVTHDKDFIEIKSPMVGTFYRAPGPGANPFVEVNSRIEAGDTVCIIEAMKLMNAIEAEVSGRVARILVENDKPVEYGQVLFLVQPD